MLTTVVRASQSTNHNITRCSAFERENTSSILDYNFLDKSHIFYKLKAFGFCGLRIVGFAGLYGFYGLSPHFQDWNS